MWTSPNRKPIFAIIGYWYTPDFEEREEVLEFIQDEGERTGERLAEIIMKLLEELKLKHKLFAITEDNASNDGTLCYHIFQRLREEYDDGPSPIRSRMRFYGKLSFIHCLAHVINLICKDVLSSLKAGSAIEAKKTLDPWEKTFKSADYIIPKDNSRSAIAKVRLLNLWISRSSQREEEWAKLPRASNRKPIYDVDTRWNSAYDMIVQYLELEAEYTDFCNSHSQVKCLLLTAEEIVSLTQLAHVLAPFKDITLRVSEAMPSIVRSLELYCDLDDLMEKVTTGFGIYLQLDQSILVAFEQGKMKHVKYIRKLEKHTMLYADLCQFFGSQEISRKPERKSEGTLSPVKLSSEEEGAAPRAPPCQSFTSKPLTFQEWLLLKRKGQDFAHTPMGYICQAKSLTATHLFFSRIEEDRKGQPTNEGNRAGEVDIREYLED